MTITVGQVEPVVDYSIRKVCKQRYANHPHGCPNWKKRSTCPPKAPSLHKVFDLQQPFYAIVNAYPFGEHMAKMKERHPGWTDRQVRNPLYWQGTARKQLKQGINDFLHDHLTYIVIRCPEACGVLITKTVAPLGIELSWPPQETAYQVALGGIPVKGLREKYPDFSNDIHWGFESEQRLVMYPSLFGGA